MSDLNDIVTVSISRQTATVARASFGVMAVIAQFATNKTTTAFDRHRYYSSLAEMTTDGWGVYDPVYLAAQKAFSQNPKVTRVMVGRKDSGDASWDAALTAIQIASSDWYAFGIVSAFTAAITFSADCVTGNSIAWSVNGITGTTPFNTNQQTTMADLKTAIEAAVTGATWTTGLTPFRTATLVVSGKRVSVSMTITGGASQPTVTSVETTNLVDQDIKDVAAWTETQKKIFGYSWSDTDILSSGSTTDIAYFLKAQGYDRTFGMFYSGSDLSFAEFAWMGETLPFDPGSQTWAYKTPAGLAAYGLTSAQRGVALGKNINIFTETAGVSITEEGKAASGEFIDVIVGLDWLQSRIQESVFGAIVAARKIPYDDTGITLIGSILSGALNEGERNGVLIDGSSVVTLPKYADIDSADKTARNLPDITFTALLEGAIQKVNISGVVTV